MVLPFDYLDSMAWDIVISAVLLGVLAIRLPYEASSDSVEAEGRNLRVGLAVAIGASGFYLFITGLAISFAWPYTRVVPDVGDVLGHYNVLFGGAATMGGLVLLATSLVLFLNGGLKVVSYLAFVVGLYIVVDAIAIVNYELTREPILSALAYLSSAVATFLSVPATHSDNKWLRWLFAIFAFLFAIAWLYQAAHFTWGHLEPPTP